MLEHYGNSTADLRWRICTVNEYGTQVIQNAITSDLLGGDALYLFNGYLYKVCYSGQEYEVCRIDINTGEQTTIIENVYKGDAAFIGQNVWYVNKVGDSVEFVISPLFMPEFKYSVGIYDGLSANYSTLTAGADSVYYQVSSLMKVWEINKNGEIAEIANTYNGNIEKFTLTRHGIVFNALKNTTLLVHNSMGVLIDGGKRISYGELLNKIAYLKEPYVLQQGDEVRIPESRKIEDGKMNVNVERDIKKENGDSVLEFSAENLTGRDAVINTFDIRLIGEQEKIEIRVMPELAIANGEERTFSIFIPKEEFDNIGGDVKIGWAFKVMLKR